MISVVIPAYQPLPGELPQVFRALLGQTAVGLISEVLLVDNNSPGTSYAGLDFSGLPGFQFFIEKTPGLTPNRLRGFREVRAASKWVLLVDQDNVLAADYLEQAMREVTGHPFLGALGGRIVPEYEREAPAFAERAPSILSLRDVWKASWSNDPAHDASTPWGAGMLIRKEVADAYVEKVRRDTRRAFLDHRGQDLLYGADNDIANTACELGYGKGVFPALRLTHLIPDSRCTWSYFSRSVEGRTLSGHVKEFLETGRTPARLRAMEAIRLVRCLVSRDPFVRVSARARYRGRQRALALLRGGKALEVLPRGGMAGE
jgi:glycosyltransferase involved in cell wall biosynthesis